MVLDTPKRNLKLYKKNKTLKVQMEKMKAEPKRVTDDEKIEKAKVRQSKSVSPVPTPRMWVIPSSSFVGKKVSDVFVNPTGLWTSFHQGRNLASERKGLLLFSLLFFERWTDSPAVGGLLDITAVPVTQKAVTLRFSSAYSKCCTHGWSVFFVYVLCSVFQPCFFFS